MIIVSKNVFNMLLYNVLDHFVNNKRFTGDKRIEAIVKERFPCGRIIHVRSILQ